MDARTDRLDAIVTTHSLNAHPFYVAWRAGTLPREALASYAAEYGLFVGEIGRGWSTLGKPEYATEEQRHAALWDDFRADLGAHAPAQPLAETRALVEAATELFATRPEALGALYAFESQQPATASSKLDGLVQHAARYRVGAPGRQYFVEHARETGETALLAQGLASLTEPEFERAVRACERMCLAMLGGLDGVTPSARC